MTNDIGDGPPTRSDAVRLRQVVDNLLSNARKFTRKGGKVSLRAQAHDDGWLIEVADTGIGIAPDRQEHIFGALLPRLEWRARPGAGHRSRPRGHPGDHRVARRHHHAAQHSRRGDRGVGGPALVGVGRRGLTASHPKGQNMNRRATIAKIVTPVTITARRRFSMRTRSSVR